MPIIKDYFTNKDEIILKFSVELHVYFSDFIITGQ